MSRVLRRGGRASVAGVALALGLATLSVARPAAAKILKTRASASSTWSSLPVIVGSGYEFETDDESTIQDFPVLLEYNFSEQVKIILEPNFVLLHSKLPDKRSAKGFGDLESALEVELWRERRYRPALSLEGAVKWPTASEPELGNPGADYSLGLVLSKDLVFLDLDFNVLYTLVGDPDGSDNLEISLAMNWRATRIIEVESEVVQTLGTGGIRGQPGTLTGLGSHGGSSETAATLGVAEHVNRNLKFEQGAIVWADLSWQIIAAWEWSFSGED